MKRKIKDDDKSIKKQKINKFEDCTYYVYTDVEIDELSDERTSLKIEIKTKHMVKINLPDTVKELEIGGEGNFVLGELPNCKIFTMRGDWTECRITRSILPNQMKNCIEFNANTCFGLTTIPNMPKLEKLVCIKTAIRFLPELPVCKHVEVRDGYLLRLPDLPNCAYLECNSNELRELPELPECKKIICNNNQLRSLPSQLDNCTKLNCSYNNLLSDLPKSMKNIKKLYCSRCALSSIPDFTTIEILNCSYNNIKSVGSLPIIKELVCNNNYILQLPQNLPECVELWCYKNALDVLPQMDKCKILYCSHNPLKVRPDDKKYQVCSFYTPVTSEVGKLHESDNCVVCMEKFVQGDLRTVYDCKHACVHKRCSFYQKNRIKCPLCPCEYTWFEQKI